MGPTVKKPFQRLANKIAPRVHVHCLHTYFEKHAILVALFLQNSVPSLFRFRLALAVAGSTCFAYCTSFRSFPSSACCAQASARMRRGRARKPRLSRMDAAVDAMAPFGFTEAQVKKRVSQLLTVYGGNDAWPFIEECAYRELLEALLRDDEGDGQENSTEDGHNEKDNCPEDETTDRSSNRVPDQEQDEIPGDDGVADMAESISTSAEPSHPKCCTDSSSAKSTSYPEHGSSSSAVLASEPQHVSNLSGVDALPVEGGRDVWKDILLNHPSGFIEAISTIDGKSSNNPRSNTSTPSKNPSPALPSVNNISSPLLANCLPTQRRRPCYGWIESDEEDLGEFITLKPAPGALQAKTTPSKRVRFERKHRSRWDVKPNDP